MRTLRRSRLMESGMVSSSRYTATKAGAIPVFQLVSSELSTPPHKLGADNHAAKASWHFAITLATDFVDQLNG